MNEKWKTRARELYEHIRIVSDANRQEEIITAALAEAAADEREACAIEAACWSPDAAVAIRARKQKP